MREPLPGDPGRGGKLHICAAIQCFDQFEGDRLIIPLAEQVLECSGLSI
jgi:hypothetical protein